MSTPVTLATHRWGDGDRVAVLIHGLFSMGVTWHLLAGVLAERGWSVIAVDLPGHGLSPRAAHYPPQLLADSVVAAVPHRPELLVGHSLGGLTARLVASRIDAERVVYVDPAFALVKDDPDHNERFRRDLLAGITVSEQQVRSGSPTWSGTDVGVELLGRQLFDPAFTSIVIDPAYRDLPDVDGPRSLVLSAAYEPRVTPDIAPALIAAGCTLRTVPDAGHCIDRDNPAGFLVAIEDWIDPPR